VVVVGERAALALIGEFGGVEIFIPNLAAVLKAYQQDRIIEEFDRLTTVDWPNRIIGYRHSGDVMIGP
jgi:hypothetical protein